MANQVDLKVEEGSVHDFPSDCGEGSPAGAEPRFRFLTGAEFAAKPDPSWLVHGLLPEGGLGVLYAPHSAGKTFIALGIAGAIATGEGFCGFATQRGLVAYVAAEGESGWKHRLAALEVGMTESQKALVRENIMTLPEPVQLANHGELRALLAALAALEEPPKLVVIDTVARCAVGLQENDAGDMGLLLAACANIHRATGATVLLVHHTGKDPSSKIRGSSAIECGADTILRVSLAGERITLRLEKQKEGRLAEPFHLRLEPVVVGGSDLDPVTSCRVVPGSEDSTPRREGGRTRGGVAEDVIDALGSLRPDEFATVADLATLTGRSESGLYKALPGQVTKGSVNEELVDGVKGYRLAGRLGGDSPLSILHDSTENPVESTEPAQPILHSPPLPPPKGGEERRGEEGPKRTGEEA